MPGAVLKKLQVQKNLHLKLGADSSFWYKVLLFGDLLFAVLYNNALVRIVNYLSSYVKGLSVLCLLIGIDVFDGCCYSSVSEIKTQYDAFVIVAGIIVKGDALYLFVALWIILDFIQTDIISVVNATIIAACLYGSQ